MAQLRHKFLSVLCRGIIIEAAIQGGSFGYYYVAEEGRLDDQAVHLLYPIFLKNSEVTARHSCVPVSLIGSSHFIDFTQTPIPILGLSKDSVAATYSLNNKEYSQAEAQSDLLRITDDGCKLVTYIMSGSLAFRKLESYERRSLDLVGEKQDLSLIDKFSSRFMAAGINKWCHQNAEGLFLGYKTKRRPRKSDASLAELVSSSMGSVIEHIRHGRSVAFVFEEDFKNSDMNYDYGGKQILVGRANGVFIPADLLYQAAIFDADNTPVRHIDIQDFIGSFDEVLTFMDSSEDCNFVILDRGKPVAAFVSNNFAAIFLKIDRESSVSFSQEGCLELCYGFEQQAGEADSETREWAEYILSDTDIDPLRHCSEFDAFVMDYVFFQLIEKADKEFSVNELKYAILDIEIDLEKLERLFKGHPSSLEQNPKDRPSGGVLDAPLPE